MGMAGFVVFWNFGGQMSPISGFETTCLAGVALFGDFTPLCFGLRPRGDVLTRTRSSPPSPSASFHRRHPPSTTQSHTTGKHGPCSQLAFLDSCRKRYPSLTYEVRVLEKELEIRNEEREFSRRTAEASHKQQLESTKKIAKLELECQRLRLLVRKRLPGPAALAKMKNEVEMLGRDSFEIRRSKLSTNSLLVESSVDTSPETPITKINTLTEQLCAVEEENKVLKESLNRKLNELQFSRVMLTRTASKLLHLESQIEDLHKGHLSVEHHISNVASHEFSFASLSDASSDDKTSCAESWASALISELDHFRSEKKKEPLSCKSVGASDINLMDDFVEMEKLAVVSVEKATQSPSASLKAVTEINSISETGTKDSTPKYNLDDLYMMIHNDCIN